MNDDNDRNEIAQGLVYSHMRSNLNTIETHRALATVETLRDLLLAHKLIDKSEFEAEFETTAQRLREEFVEQGMTVAIQEHPTSKYLFEGGAEIDCESRIEHCRAACCRLQFALSKEDVEEGVVRWDLSRPYLIAHGSNGSCVHLDPETKGCGVYRKRPLPCRKYDCSNDRRIWEDFEKMIPNPRVYESDWPLKEMLEGVETEGK